MKNTLTNYTNKQRAEFIQQAEEYGKRIEKYDNTLYALAENEIVQNGQIVIDNEREQRLRQTQFEKEFFNTSLGWVRRNVTMQDRSVKSFLTDILPLLVEEAEILTYDTELNQSKVAVTNEFLNECKQQLLKDFYGE